MNYKKLIITAAAAALVFGGAAGAFAHGNKNHNPAPTPVPVSTVVVTNNRGVDNTSVNVANTGANFVTAPKVTPAPESGHNKKGDKGTQVPSVTVTTGAASASQYTTNSIDTSAGCGCTTTGVSTTYVTNNGSVSNLSVNVANSGLNMVSGGSLTTRAASASQVVSNTINTSVGPI